MVVRTKDNGHSFSVSLKNKAKIYRNFLHDKTEWLGLTKKDVSAIMKQMAKNLNKKGL
ncbi:MAG: hypothetical protein ACTSQY_08230 [Candidatus Odinarchaeia archaeon]